MNSIILTHVAATSRELLLDAALSRLGAYIDAEAGSLEDFLALTGEEAAIHDILVLRDLHLDAGATPADIRQLLARAGKALERLLDRVREIPFEAAFIEQAPSDFDAWHRWTGARLQDISTTLSRALAR